MNHPPNPWHYGQSTTFEDGCQSVEEALAAADLNWEVVKRDIYYSTQRLIGGVPTEVLEQTIGFSATVRSDTGDLMGVVGTNYTPIQNQEAFSIVDPILEEHNAVIRAMGSFKNGRVLWMYVEVGDEMEIVPGDSVAPRLMLLKSHDSSSSFRAIPMAARMRCNNVVPTLLRNGKVTSIRVRHSGDTQVKLDTARRALESTYEAFNAYVEAMKRFSETPINSIDLARYMHFLFPPTEGQDGDPVVSPILLKKRQTFKNLWNMVGTMDDPNRMDPEMAGTAYAAYQCATYYANHVQPVQQLHPDPQCLRWSRMINSGDTHVFLSSAKDFFGEEG